MTSINPTALLLQQVQASPQQPELWNELGITHAKQSQWREAIQALERALALRPGYAIAWQNLGRVWQMTNQPAQAELALLRAVLFSGGDPSAILQLAELYKSGGKTALAVATLRGALERHRSATPNDAPGPLPGSLELHRELIALLIESNDLATATTAVATAIQQHPQAAPLYELRGQIERLSSQDISAGVSYAEALRLDPHLTSALANQAHWLADQGDCERARDSYARALVQTEDFRIRVARATALPAIPESVATIDFVRDRLARELSELSHSGARVETLRDAMPNLFYLAYHGRNDRSFHESLGKLGTLRNTPPSGPRAPGKPRIGVVSRFLRDHTIGRLNIGWLERLPKDLFDLHLFAIGPTDDDLARRYRALSPKWFGLPMQLASIAKTIADQKLDLLLHLDIGMEPSTLSLAFSRLARRQAVTWGHPVTTGLPTIDDFISAKTAEPDEAEAHYTERLVRFPTLGVCYERPVKISDQRAAKVAARTELGLPPQQLLLTCPQTLFKFHPEFDLALEEICTRLPTARLLLIEGKFPTWRARLEARWQQAAPAALRAALFLPPLPRARYLSLLTASDIVLDPFHFSGGNSSYEVLGVGTPLVTLPGDLLRGRLTLAMYRQMGFERLVASSPGQYVELACQLAANPDFHSLCEQEIAQRSHLLFNDQAAVEAWTCYFQDTTSSQP
jgi:protein O-GlcNAc transferase